MRFEVEDNRVFLPVEHPVASGGSYTALALVECAAQLAGRRVEAVDDHVGMLVELTDLVPLADRVPGGRWVAFDVSVDRTMGPLWRFGVRIEGILEVGLTLRVGTPA